MNVKYPVHRVALCMLLLENLFYLYHVPNALSEIQLSLNCRSLISVMDGQATGALSVFAVPSTLTQKDLIS